MSQDQYVSLEIEWWTLTSERSYSLQCVSCLAQEYYWPLKSYDQSLTSKNLWLLVRQLPLNHMTFKNYVRTKAHDSIADYDGGQVCPRHEYKIRKRTKQLLTHFDCFG